MLIDDRKVVMLDGGASSPSNFRLQRGCSLTRLLFASGRAVGASSAMGPIHLPYEILGLPLPSCAASMVLCVNRGHTPSQTGLQIRAMTKGYLGLSSCADMEDRDGVSAFQRTRAQ